MLSTSLSTDNSTTRSSHNYICEVGRVSFLSTGACVFFHITINILKSQKEEQSQGTKSTHRTTEAT